MKKDNDETRKLAKAAREYCDKFGSFFFEYSDESNELIDAFEAGYNYAKSELDKDEELK